MQKRTAIILPFIMGYLLLSFATDQKSPSFFFGGQQIRIGMSQQEAVAALSRCCKLTPPVESGVQKRPALEGLMAGHFILSKEESPQGILGAIYFSGGRVLRVTRPLAEEVDGYNDDVVGFARALKRSLAADENIETTSALVAIRHERMGNAESDVVLLTLRDGRGIEIHIGTLDKPDALTNKRDFVTLDETLGPAEQRPQARN